MSTYFRLLAEVDQDELIQVLAENSGDDYVNVVAFVKQLDGHISDWDFTRKLYKYFAAEVALIDFEG